MDVETQAWEELPGSSTPNFNTIGNHGADIQLRASIKVSIKAATDLPFPLNKFIIFATEDQKLQNQQATGREQEKNIASC